MNPSHHQGPPCKRGHDGLRFNANNSCVQCTKDKALAAYHKDPVAWNERNKRWHKENRERSKAIYERYWASRPGLQNHYNSLRRAALDQRTPMWADIDKILAFYENCPKGMTVDHIVPLRGETVSGLHVHNNLQYLTGPENSTKGNKWSDDA